MSLIPLTDYKTLSDKKLLQVFNDAMTAVDANFTYTLGQVASPVPSLTGVAQDSVLAVGQSNSNNILEYVNVNDLVNLQTVFTSYTEQNSKINLANNLEFSINKLGSPFAAFSVTSRGSSGAGAINNYMQFSQLSTSGELNETHVVGAFSLTSNSVSITANTGFVELNKLQVGNYKFPNTAGTTGQLLRLGASNTLEFAAVNNQIVEQTNNYALNQNKALLLKGKGNSDVSLAIYDLNSGIGASQESLNGNQEVFFKFNDSRLLTMTKPINPSVGSPDSAYLKLEGPTTLPSVNAITPQNSHEGSLWYDGLNNSLVVITPQGRLSLRAQSSAVAAAINTEEAKSFTLNPAATIALGQGTNSSPAIKVGNVGLTSTSQDLKIVFGNTPVVKITGTSIEPNVQANGAAKVLFDSNLGFNNPTNPPYTFSGAFQLGMYRSASNSIGMAVQGVCVSEFSSTGLDLKNKRLFNIAAPVGALDAVNKQYVDALIPIGATANSLPVYNTTSNKYVESEAKYASGVLEVGSSANAGSVLFKTTGGGTVTLSAPTGNQNLTFLLPATTLTDGIMRVNAQGQLYWDSKNTVTSGLLKTDGSIQMTGGIRMASATTKTNPLIGIGTTGMYAAEGLTPKVGFASLGDQLFEIDATTKTLTGTSLLDRGPYIRLITADDTTPVYGFAENQTSGLASATGGVAVVVSGSQKLTVTSTGVSVHSQKITNVATPTSSNDAANKQYVDDLNKEPLEVSFRITSLPSGWTLGNSITLSLIDKALVYQNTIAYLEYIPDPFPANVTVPINFMTNAKCQCYVENSRLIKVPKNNIAQVARVNSGALLLNFNIAVNQIITVQLPG